MKKNRSLKSTLSDEDERETDHHNKDNSEASDMVAFNAIINLKDNSLYVENGASEDESLYSDEEISYEELQEKYNLLYVKWIDFVIISNTLKKDL